MSESKHKDPKDYKTHVGNFTSGKLDYLQSEQENGEGKALLARLRHAAGKSPEESPEIWGFILSEFDSYKSKEAIIDETTNIPVLTPEEESAFHALTLYAVASQGERNRESSTHVKEVSIGTAFGNFLKNDSTKENYVRTKMKLLIQSKTIEETARRLRPMIKYLTTNNGLDFAMLAEHLSWCANPKNRRMVHLRWARDYCVASHLEQLSDQEQSSDLEQKGEN